MHSPVAVGDTIQLTIDSLAYGSGDGVGRHDGFVVFVPFCAPGDLVEVKVAEVKKGFARGAVERVLKPGSGRREPRCAVFGQCGGCQWQHLEYSVQLRQKRDLLAAHLRDLVASVKMEAAPEEWRYRNRIQVQVRDGKRGFFARQSQRLVETNDCPVAEAALAERLANLPDTESRTKIELYLDRQGAVREREVRRDPQTRPFGQINSKVNKLLIAEVLQRARNCRFQSILDLYCGDGNFTLPLAEEFATADVTGVDLSRDNIAAGRALATQAGLPRVRLEASDCGVFLRSQPNLADTLVVLDPARAGLDREVRDSLIRLRPPFVIYVSCNPPTLRRDLEYLRDGGFNIGASTGFDMFPQTSHIEVITSLYCAAK
jgi:tRNA/tmRNA/rRNA uracil-C5-methylase (TrmA/RlmC/RlmD family)